jgi:hypothetical protein
MVAALYGLNVAWIKTFLAKSGSRSVHFHTNPATTARFIQALKDTVVATDRPSLTWTEHMLSLERNARPTAARVLETITSPEHDDTSSTANVFCDICCVPDYESLVLMLTSKPTRVRWIKRVKQEWPQTQSRQPSLSLQTVVAIMMCSALQSG